MDGREIILLKSPWKVEAEEEEEEEEEEEAGAEEAES